MVSGGGRVAARPRGQGRRRRSAAGALLGLCLFGQWSPNPGERPSLGLARGLAAEPGPGAAGERPTDGEDHAAPGSAAEEARAAFERGRERYLRGAYADALPHFRRAYVLSGRRPSAIRALAQCERALESTEAALTLFGEYLATNPAPADGAFAEAAIADLEARRGARPGAPEDRRPAPLLWGEPEAPGDTARVPRALDPIEPGPPAEAARSLLTEPWFWVIAGALTLAGGGALAFALGAPDDPAPPYGGSLGRVLVR